MKISFIKQPGGSLIPASDIEAGRMERFKSGEMYDVDIKLQRNPQFHKKVFAFFGFCFNYWKSGEEYQNEAKQFDVFRNNMTVLAGYYEEFYGIDGRVRIEATSLSYGSMTQDEFEGCYSALINVALRKIFNADDSSVEERLYSFF